MYQKDGTSCPRPHHRSVLQDIENVTTFLCSLATILLSGRESKGGNSEDKLLNIRLLNRIILMIIEL